MIKTPSYALKAQKAYFGRLKSKGWKKFSRYLPPSVLEKVKAISIELLAEYRASEKEKE